MLAARETVKQTAAGRYPTLTGAFSYGTEAQGFPPSVSGSLNTIGRGFQTTDTTTANGTLNLNFPVFQSNYVTHATKQQEYNYLSASDQLDFTHRTVVKQTRQAYLGVDSGISKIQADQQAIISAQNKLEATQAGYTVGTRTMVDVLQAVTNLYQAQQQWATDRYTYVMNIITLKQQAGTLSPKDLAQINTWLGQTVVFDLRKPITISKYATTRMPNPMQNAVPPKDGQPTRYFHGPNVKPLGHHQSKTKNVSEVKVNSPLPPPTDPELPRPTLR